MAEPTNSLATLRRRICRQLRMPFFNRFASTSTLTNVVDTANVDDTNLRQANDFWNGQWFYRIASQETRLITDFINATRRMTLEYPLGTATNGDTYEIHSRWSAHQIHEAINRAISESFPAFFDYVDYSSIVLEEDKLFYSLVSAGITQPWMVAKVFVEQNYNVMRGITTDSASGYFVDTNLIGRLGSVTTSWLVSIYSGPSPQVRAITAVNNSAGQISSSNFSPLNPGTGVKYALWNPNIQQVDWERVMDVRFDQKEWPNTLYLGRLRRHLYGLRMRIEYSARPLSLSAEADTTVVPDEYLVNKVLAYLFAERVNDNRVDRGRYAQLAEMHMNLAENYKRARAFRHPDITLWQEPIPYDYQDTIGDPLGWRN